MLLRRTRAIHDGLERFVYKGSRYFSMGLQYWEQAPNHAIAEWLDIVEQLAKTYKNLITMKKNKEQSPITGCFSRILAETPQARHNRIFKKRPPRKPPHGG